jgi:hypothetical protein
MSPEFSKKWERLLEDVDKQSIPIEFIRKLVIKLYGKKQQTINIEKLMKQGLAPDMVEEIVNNKLTELDEDVIRIEFVLNVQSIANTVQPETDRLLNKL